MRFALLAGAAWLSLSTSAMAESYVRIDVARQFLETQDAQTLPLSTQPTILDKLKQDDATRVGAGIGFRVTPWLRTELVLEHRFESDVQTRLNIFPAALSTSSTAGFAQLWIEPESLAIGPLRPYFGGGVGLAYNRFHHGSATLPAPLPPFGISGNDNFSPAWRIGGGLSMPITGGLTAEIGYSFTDYGNVRAGDRASTTVLFPPGASNAIPASPNVELRAHAVNVSLRYAIGDSPTASDLPAFASVRGLTLRVEAGGSLPRDPDLTIPSIATPVGATLDPSVQVGAGIGWRYNQYLRSELLVDWSPEYQQVSFNPGRPVGKSSIASTTVLAALWADLLPAERISPYVGFGLGGANNSYGDLAITDGSTGRIAANVPGASQWQFAWMVGAGVGTRIADRLVLDLGWRYVDRGEYRNGVGFAAVGTGTANIQSVGKLRSNDFLAGLRWEL